MEEQQDFGGIASQYCTTEFKEALIYLLLKVNSKIFWTYMGSRRSAIELG